MYILKIKLLLWVRLSCRKTIWLFYSALCCSCSQWNGSSELCIGAFKFSGASSVNGAKCTLRLVTIVSIAFRIKKFLPWWQGHYCCIAYLYIVSRIYSSGSIPTHFGPCPLWSQLLGPKCVSGEVYSMTTDPGSYDPGWTKRWHRVNDPGIMLRPIMLLARVCLFHQYNED